MQIRLLNSYLESQKYSAWHCVLTVNSRMYKDTPLVNICTNNSNTELCIYHRQAELFIFLYWNVVKKNKFTNNIYIYIQIMLIIFIEDFDVIQNQP